MMDTDDEVFRNLENLLTNTGKIIDQFICYLGQRNSTILNLPDEKQIAFCDLYDQIESGRLSKSEKGKALEKLVSILFGESFICECKNYDKKLKVTYVGKFYFLLAVTKMKFGLVVSWEGISGRGEWTDSKGFIKKVALSDDTFIVTLDKHDLKQIYDQSQNIYSMLMEKYDILRADISYKQYISSHEAEPIFI